MKIVFRYLLFWVIHKYPSKQYIILSVDIGYTCTTMCLCRKLFICGDLAMGKWVFI